MNDRYKYNRKSIRLKNYDYSQSGFYFITICVKDRYHLFGEVIENKMVLNDYGQIAKDEWLQTGKLRNNVRLDEFVVMPNHIHGIIQLIERRDTAVESWDTEVESWDTARRVPTKEQFGKPTKNSIPTIIRSYKSAVTKSVNELNHQKGDKVWQKNYYEHIIRNREELDRIRKYIKYNPVNWGKDKLNG